MRRSLRASVLGSLILSGGCGAESPAGPEGPGKGPITRLANGNALQLISITPAKGTRLRAGEPVTVNVTLYYSLASFDFSDVELHLLNQGGLGLNEGVFVPVRRGSGTLTLTNTATVPPRGNDWITVACGMWPQGSGPVELTVKYNVQ